VLPVGRNLGGDLVEEGLLGGRGLGVDGRGGED